MKILDKTIKPRNPLALAARQRKAGAHDEQQNSARYQRRTERQQLKQWLRYPQEEK